MPHAASLYYFEHRAGSAELPSVVLLHGAGGNYLSWPTQIRRLDNLHVYAPDLPGHGKSDGRGLQTIDDYAHHIRAWMDAIQLPRAVIVGHSMGGAIALSLAVQHPQYVVGLGLMATGAQLKVADAILDNASRAETFPLVMDTLKKWAFGPTAPASLIKTAIQRIAETRPSVLHSDFLACNAYNLTGKLSAIHIPALVLCGDADRMTPARLSQYLADHLPDAELRIFPQAGHMLMLEYPDEVAAALQAFVHRIPFRPGL